MSGKRYPEEFKIEAVKQVVDRFVAGPYKRTLALALLARSNSRQMVDEALRALAEKTGRSVAELRYLLGPQEPKK